MGVKATEFGTIIIEKHVGFRGELKFPEAFLPTKLVGEGTFGRNDSDKFGTSVSVDGDLAVVGVPSQDYDENGESTLADAGVVFVYRRTRDSWEFAYRISAPTDDRSSQDNFGYSVSLKGNTLIVGAPKNALDVSKANPVEGAGAAFIYTIEADNFVFNQKVVPVVRDSGDNFGVTVTAQDNVVFVGSYMHGRDGQDVLDAPEAGAVWAFGRVGNSTNWELQKKIVAGGNERNAYDYFGTTVSAHNNILVVGVPNYDFANKGTDKKTDAGIAYVFGWNVDHWEHRQQLAPVDREAGDKFGFAVSVFDDKIAIGAPGKNGNIGKVYQYLKDPATLNYSLVDEVEPTMLELPVDFTPLSDPALIANSQFGYALSQNSTHLVVGAPTQASLNVISTDTTVTPHTYVGSTINNVGYTYVYEVAVDSTLTLSKKFTGSDRFGIFTNNREPGQNGYSVSIGTNIIIVGEPKASLTSAGTNYAQNAGLAHVYVLGNNGYEYSKTLEGFYVDRNTTDAFASDFAGNDRYFVFTATGQDYDSNNENYTSNTGAAYVWEYVGGAWSYKQKLTALDRSTNLDFGRKVIVLEDRIFISADEYDNKGSVYVFQLQNGKFAQTQKIQHADVVSGDLFGSNIFAIDNRLFIASTTASVSTVTNHGAIWEYMLDDSTNQYLFNAKIVPTSLRETGSNFGWSMAVNDNILVVGAPNHSYDTSDITRSTDAGAAFVFIKSNNVWTQLDKLTGPGNDRDINDYMGYSVSSYGDILAVGIPNANVDLSQNSYLDNAGKVYFYKRVSNTWVAAGGIVSPNRTTNGAFGKAISMTENAIVVGAPGEPEVLSNGNGNGYGDGRAYVFEKQFSDWVLTGTLQNTEDKFYQNGVLRFGISVSIDGTRVIVGETGNSTDTTANTSLTNAGAAWIFEKTTAGWTNIAKLTQDALKGRAAGNQFGYSVDIKGDLAVVGAPYDTIDADGNNPLAQSGSVSVFRRSSLSNGTITWSPEKKLAGVAQDRNLDDMFGSEVVSNGTYVAVSALGHGYDAYRDNFVEAAGAVFIYQWQNNSLVYLQKVIAFEDDDRYENAGFGMSMAMSNTHLVVASPTFNKDALGATTDRQIGKVWTYRISNGLFVNETTFRPTNPLDFADGDTNYGSSIAVQGTSLVIGAFKGSYGASSTSVTNGGFAEVFRYNVDHWELETILQPPAREANDFFGQQVSVRDEIIVIGSYSNTTSTPSITDDGKNFTGGSAFVYVFKDNAWTLTHKLVRGAAERVVGDAFGTSVAVDGDYMLIGSPNTTQDSYSNDGVNNAGAAYVFKHDPLAGWVFTRKLTAPTKVANSQFGFAVQLRDDLAIISAPSEDAGVVYTFRRSAEPTRTLKTRRTAKFLGTGASQNFVVPEGITQLNAYLWGASGSSTTSGSAAGNGGFVRITLDVTPGETLVLNVGTKPAGSAAGGGRSELLRGSTTIAVAGGGGGANSSGAYNNYISIGGSAGENGYSGNENTIPGRAGTLNSGGPAVTTDSANFWIGQAGAFKKGGDGADPVNGSTVNPGGWPNGGTGYVKSAEYAICGGGDGWYGGSGGALRKNLANGYSAPGGGGSSYIAPGIDGIMNTIKTELEDQANLLNDMSYRPGVNNNGYILIEYFLETQTEDWTFEQRIVPVGLTPISTMKFGQCIEFDGASIAITSPGYNRKKDGTIWAGGGAGGATSVFYYNGFEWTLSGNVFPFGLNSYHGSMSSSYGTSVTIYGDYMVVGARLADFDASGENSLLDAGVGFAYYKENGVWKNLERLVPPGGVRNSGDLIGTSVATYGDWVAIGAPGHDFNEVQGGQISNAGAVFMWKWNGSNLEFKQKIVAPVLHRKYRANFGTKVNLDSVSLLVSAPGYMLNDTSMMVDGQVFEYTLDGDTWVNSQVIDQPSTDLNNAFFGGAISRDGNKLAISAPNTLVSALSLGPTTTLYYRLNDEVLPTNPKVWSLELRWGKNSQSTTYDSFGTLNVINQAPGSFGISGSGTTLSVFGYNNDGNRVEIGTMSATTKYYNFVIKRTNSNRIEAWVDGILRGSVDASAFDVSSDFENGFILRSYSDTVRGSYGFIRLSYEDVNAELQDGASIGLRPTTRMFVNFGNDTTDLTGNYDYDEDVTGELEPDYYFVYDNGVDVDYENGGQVYLFDRFNDAWVYDQTVTCWSLTSVTDHFGYSLSLKDDLLLVGSYGHALDQNDTNAKSNAGAVFFYKNIAGTYVPQQKIVAWGHDVNAGDLAGDNIISFENTIAVAAPGHPYDANGNNFLVGAGAVYIWRLESNNWIFEQKLAAPSRSENDGFGSVMAMNGTTLVVGCPSSSKAWVFEKELNSTAINCWSAGVELVPSADTTPGTYGFGYSVAVDTTSKDVVVGAPGHTSDISGANDVSNAGAAFIFNNENGSWICKQKIVNTGVSLNDINPLPRNEDDLFGASVGISGNTIVVGVPQYDYDSQGNNIVTDAGSAVVFTRANTASVWSQFQILDNLSNYRNPGDMYGASMATNGTYLAVGLPAYSYDINNVNYLADAGMVAIWKLDGTTWTLSQSLTAGDGNGNVNRKASAYFGWAVAMNGPTLFVSAPSKDNTLLGEVFEFTLDSNGKYIFASKLLDTQNYTNSSANQLFQAFGYSIDYDGTTLLIGNPSRSNSWFGQAHLYEKINNTWTLLTNIRISTTSNNGTINAASGAYNFGATVSVQGNIAAVGNAIEDGQSRGAVMIWTKTNGTWVEADRAVSQIPARETGEQFGYSLASDGDFLAVGLPTSNNGALNRLAHSGVTFSIDSGAVIIFKRNSDGTYQWHQRISPPTGTFHYNSGDNFGYSMAMEGDTLIVGAPFHSYDVNGANPVTGAGAVFEFRKNDSDVWMYTTKLVAQGYLPRNANDNFGTNLVYQDRTLAVGAGNHNYGKSASDSSGSDIGAVFVFRRIDDVWYFVDKAIGEENGISRKSGLKAGNNAMALNNGILVTALLGANLDPLGTDSLTNAGAVMVHKIDSLDALQVKLLGTKYTVQARTQIAFDSSTGLYQGVNIINNGSGYTSAPEVIFSNTDFEGYAKLQPTTVANVVLNTLDPNAESPTITIVRDPLDNSGADATAVVHRGNPTINNVTVTYSGSGYTDSPVINVTNSQNVELEAVLKPTYVTALTLNGTTGGYVTTPTVTLDTAPTGGTTATAHAIMSIENLALKTTDLSYIGEHLELVVSGTPAAIRVTNVDAQSRILSFALTNTGMFQIPTATNIASRRVIETQTYGAINESLGAPPIEDYGTLFSTMPDNFIDRGQLSDSVTRTIDYGSLTGSSSSTIDHGFIITNRSVTSSEDYGYVSQSVTSSEDYMDGSGVFSYGPITETPSESQSYGLIRQSLATFDATMNISSLVLDNPGSGYRSTPAVTIQGVTSKQATGIASVNPVGVDYVNIINGGKVENNSVIVFAGTDKAQATFSTGPGAIDGVTITYAGSNYTRTPTVQFSNPSFTGQVILNPTGVASVVTTKSDNTLTLQGNVKYKKYITEPNSMRRENQNFGSAIVGAGSTLVVGAPMPDPTNTTTIVQSAFNSGQVMVFEATNINGERDGKIEVNGFLDASSVLNDISNDFTVNLWIKTSNKQRALNSGTILSARNNMLGEPTGPNARTRLINDGTYVVPAGITKLEIAGWGAGNSDASYKPANGGFVDGTFAVTAGQTFSVKVGKSDGVDNGVTTISLDGTQIASIASGTNAYIGARTDIGTYGRPTDGTSFIDPSFSGTVGNYDWLINRFGNIVKATYSPDDRLLANVKDVWNDQNGVGNVYNSNTTVYSFEAYSDNNWFAIDRGYFIDGVTGTLYPNITHLRDMALSWDRSMLRTSELFTNTDISAITFKAYVRMPVTEIDGNFVFNSDIGSTGQGSVFSKDYTYSTTHTGTAFVGLTLSDGVSTSIDSTYEGIVDNYHLTSVEITLQPGESKCLTVFLTTEFAETEIETQDMTTAGDRAYVVKNTNPIVASENLFRTMNADYVSVCANFDTVELSSSFTTTTDSAKFQIAYNAGENADTFSTEYDSVQGLGSASSSGGNGMVAFYPVITAQANSHLLNIDATGVVRMAGVNTYNITGFVDIDTSWHNVTYKVEGSKAFVYWDGEYVGSTDISNGSSDKLVFGGQFRENKPGTDPLLNPYRGFMSDIAIWNTSLSDQQILDVVNTSARDVASNSLIALWSEN
jgi:FG-GAP repeat